MKFKFSIFLMMIILMLGSVAAAWGQGGGSGSGATTAETFFNALIEDDYDTARQFACADMENTITLLEAGLLDSTNSRSTGFLGCDDTPDGTFCEFVMGEFNPITLAVKVGADGVCGLELMPPAANPNVTVIDAEQTLTEDGFLQIGDPAAPIILAVVSDFKCSHCQNFFPEYWQLVNEYAPSGQAAFQLILTDAIGNEDSALASQFAFCAAEQGHGWDFARMMFVEAATSGRAFDTSSIVNLATQLPVNSGDLNACVEAARSTEATAAANAFMSIYRVSSTPKVLYSLDGGTSFTVLSDRNYDTLVSLIEANQ